MFRKIFLKLLLTTSLISPALAQNTNLNAQDVTQLQESFSFANEFYDLIGSNQNISVTQEDAYYKVVFPGLVIQKEDKPLKLLGDIVVHALPTEKDNVFAVTMAIPSQYGFMAGEEGIQVSIGNQLYKGLWQASERVFLSSDYKYNDIDVSVKSTESNLNASFSVEDYSGNFKAQPNGDKYNTVEKITINNLNLANNGVQLFSNDKIIATGNTKNLDYKKLYNVIGDVFQNIKNFKNTSKIESSDQESLIEASKSFETVIADLQKIYTATNSSFEIENLRFTNPKTNEPVTIKDIDAKFSIANNFENETQDLSYGFTFDIPTIPNMDPSISKLLPNMFSAGLSVKNLPVRIFTEQELRQTESNIENLDEIVTMLSNNNSVLEFNNLSIVGPDYRVQLAGTVQADASAAQKTIANMNLRLTGVQNLTQKINALPDTVPNVAQIKKMAGGLMMASMMGQPDPADPNTIIFNFELDATGQMLLNGQDLKQLQQSFGN